MSSRIQLKSPTSATIAPRQSLITIVHGGVGRWCGVGRDLGVALGVGVGVGLAVGEGVAVGVGVGVGVPPGTLNL